MLSLYVNYRASSFVFCFPFLKNKELLKFVPQMSVSVSYVQDSTVSLMFL